MRFESGCVCKTSPRNRARIFQELERRGRELIHVPAKCLADQEIGERFDVIGYPTYFLIDPEGRIRGKYIGKIEEELPRLQEDIGRLRRGLGAAKEDE